MATSDADAKDPLEPVRAVFAGHEDQLGTPEAPTKEGFLALARAGRDVWNAWRAEWPRRDKEGPAVDFGGVDFRETPIDFSGFVFGDEAEFDGAQFGERANFEGAQFGVWANFADAQFSDAAKFNGAQFGDWTIFDGVQFAGWAIFSGAQFGDWAIFSGAQFGDWAIFDGAQFGDWANFAASTRTRVEHDRQSWLHTRTARSAEELTQRAKQLELRSDAFANVSFSGAQFHGDVSFQNRKFLGKTKFDALTEPLAVPAAEGGERTIGPRPTRFEGVPDFHSCTLHQDTSFEQAKFLAPPTEGAARAYRTLKLAMAQQQSTREEQRFFRLEMKAEAASEWRLPWLQRPRALLFFLYGFISDYGFSVWRPLALWGICLVIAVLGLGYLAGLDFSLAKIDWQRTKQLWQYTLINTVPLPGFDKVQATLRDGLFGEDHFPFGAFLLEAFHKTVSLIALFLLGLALRNLFKMKG